MILQSKIGLRMFRKAENRKLCEAVLREVAERHEIEIMDISVMPDHVHLIAGIPPTMSVSDALCSLKGYELFRAKLQKEIPNCGVLESFTVRDADFKTTIM